MQIDLDEQIEQMLKQVQSKCDVIIPLILKDGAKIIEDAVKAELTPHIGTGELIESVKAKGPYISKYTNGAYMIVTAWGASKSKKYTVKRVRMARDDERVGNRKLRREGDTRTAAYRNYQKLLSLEYGNSHQLATPVMRPASIKSADAVKAKIIEMAQKELNKI